MIRGWLLLVPMSNGSQRPAVAHQQRVYLRCQLDVVEDGLHMLFECALHAFAVFNVV